MNTQYHTWNRKLFNNILCAQLNVYIQYVTVRKLFICQIIIWLVGMWMISCARKAVCESLALKFAVATKSWWTKIISYSMQNLIKWKKYIYIMLYIYFCVFSSKAHFESLMKTYLHMFLNRFWKYMLETCLCKLIKRTTSEEFIFLFHLFSQIPMHDNLAYSIK